MSRSDAGLGQIYHGLPPDFWKDALREVDFLERALDERRVRAGWDTP